MLWTTSVSGAHFALVRTPHLQALVLTGQSCPQAGPDETKTWMAESDAEPATARDSVPRRLVKMPIGTARFILKYCKRQQGRGVREASRNVEMTFQAIACAGRALEQPSVVPSWTCIFELLHLSTLSNDPLLKPEIPCRCLHGTYTCRTQSSGVDILATWS